MSDRSSEPKLPCRWCRVSHAHLMSCPRGNPVAETIWSTGYHAAVNRKANRHADDATYTLGYVCGELFLKEEDKRERSSEPPARASIPGDVEISLVLHESRHPAPSIRPTPPVGQAFVDALVAKAESAIY